VILIPLMPFSVQLQRTGETIETVAEDETRSLGVRRSDYAEKRMSFVALDRLLVPGKAVSIPAPRSGDSKSVM